MFSDLLEGTVCLLDDHSVDSDWVAVVVSQLPGDPDFVSTDGGGRDGRLLRWLRCVYGDCVEVVRPAIDILHAYLELIVLDLD